MHTVQLLNSFCRQKDIRFHSISNILKASAKIILISDVFRHWWEWIFFPGVRAGWVVQPPVLGRAQRRGLARQRDPLRSRRSPHRVPLWWRYWSKAILFVLIVNTERRWRGRVNLKQHSHFQIWFPLSTETKTSKISKTTNLCYQLLCTTMSM